MNVVTSDTMRYVLRRVVMTKFITIVVYVLLGYSAVMAEESAAVTPKSFFIRVNAGGIYTPDMGIFSGLGIAAGGGVGIRLDNSFSLLVGGNYSGFTGNNKEIKRFLSTFCKDTSSLSFNYGGTFPLRLTEITIETHYRFSINTRVPSVYLIGGIGFQSLFHQEISAHGPSESVYLVQGTFYNVGYLAGVGLDVPLGKDNSAFFSEIRFLNEAAKIDVRSINRYFLQLRAGVQFNL